MNKMRRLSDHLRLLADKAWAQGRRDMSTDLHEAARREEERRKNEDVL